MINKQASVQSFSIFFAFSFLLMVVLNKMHVFEKNGIDYLAVLVGNLVLFAVTVLSFVMSMRSLRSPNPNASVRSLYGSFILKFFVIAIAAFVYIMVAKKNVNKPALMICMGLYLVYSFLEVSSLQKLLKQKKDA